MWSRSSSSDETERSFVSDEDSLFLLKFFAFHEMLGRLFWREKHPTSCRAQEVDGMMEEDLIYDEDLAKAWAEVH